MTNLFEAADNEQQEIEREADDIAANITKILVDAFKVKENRDPTADELDMLLSELTEERIAEMLGETFVPRDDESDEDDFEAEDEEDEEVEDVPVPTEKDPVVDTPEVAAETILDVENNTCVNEYTDETESTTKKRKLDDGTASSSEQP